MNIFISYDQANEKVARELASRLSESGHDVWYTGGRAFPGDNVPLLAGKALKESDAMVVLVSPESMRSSWVQSDISFAFGSPRFAGRLIPVIVQPTDDVPGIFHRLSPIRAVRDLGKTSRQILQRL